MIWLQQRRWQSTTAARAIPLEKGEPPGQGPNLFGIIGRKAGTAVAFNYSERFKKAMEGQTWDEKNCWIAGSRIPRSSLQEAAWFIRRMMHPSGKKLIRFLSSLQ
ncbi:c-type cytochrome [Undibacterium arcticum]